MASPIVQPLAICLLSYPPQSTVSASFPEGEANSKMADENNVCRVSAFENVDEILSLLWGESVREDIFERWSQGKDF